MNRVNISKVAEMASVSQSTVSRALNGSGYVSSAAKEKVKRVVSDLGYRQNMLAKKLRTSETRFIGLVIPDITNDFFARLAKSIEVTLQKEGYALFLCNSEEDPQKEDFYITTLLDNQVDAIITTPSTKVANKKLLSSTIPIVYADRIVQTGRSNVASITSDNECGGRLAAEKLIAAKSANIVVLKEGRRISTAATERMNGFVKTLEAFPRIKYTSFDTAISAESGYAMMDRIIGERKFDALFCTSDVIAIGAIKCLNDHRISIPDSVQVIGFDGISMGTFLIRPLTTIVQDVESMGKAIGNTVLAMIRGKPFSRLTVLPVSLLERETTK
ncbi:LacI family transcriptional regulator [Spirochaetia bacterium]|nr:LacI family transcriptional regulator [Spirochaetia bacterium]